MHDWTGSRARAEALTVVCPYCHAQIGDACVTERGTELVAFPAHTLRTSLAERKSK